MQKAFVKQKNPVAYKKATQIHRIYRSRTLNRKDYYFFKLSASVLDVSPIIGATVLVVSDVGGGLMLLVVSELVLSELMELSLPFPQEVKTAAITMNNNIFFIINLFFFTATTVAYNYPRDEVNCNCFPNGCS